jgi:hypothetical protein
MEIEQLAMFATPDGGGIPAHEFTKQAPGWTWDHVKVLRVVSECGVAKAPWVRLGEILERTPFTRTEAEAVIGRLVPLGCLAVDVRRRDKGVSYENEWRITAAGRKELKRVPPILLEAEHG